MVSRLPHLSTHIPPTKDPETVPTCKLATRNDACHWLSENCSANGCSAPAGRAEMTTNACGMDFVES
jgi:hypothetical protein